MMNLFEPIQKALAEQQYVTPTPIQSKTIPAALDGQDILGCAQTGTGKTAAFALPTLDYLGQEQLQSKAKRPIVLVLAPTRELAIQINDSFRVYGKHIRFRQALVYGGVGQGAQVKALRTGAEVLVATPGRLLDLMEQGHVQLGDIEVFILDEADRMLDMGFLPDLKKIIAKLPEERQSMFFSATMPPKIRQLSAQLLFEPFSVDVTPKSTSVKKIKQSVRLVDRGDRVDLLRATLVGDDVDRAIVFTRTKHGADGLARKLARAGLDSAVIHGNKSQGARQRALASFRAKEVKVLIATDVAARGIDIDNVTHVVNFDMPVEAESYVHRIGRTGRAGAEGIAISFCTPDERGELRAIEKLTKQRLPVDTSDLPIPPKGTPIAPKVNSGGGNQRRRKPKSRRAAGGNKTGNANASRSESKKRNPRGKSKSAAKKKTRRHTTA